MCKSVTPTFGGSKKQQIIKIWERLQSLEINIYKKSSFCHIRLSFVFKFQLFFIICSLLLTTTQINRDPFFVNGHRPSSSLVLILLHYIISSLSLSHTHIFCEWSSRISVYGLIIIIIIQALKHTQKSPIISRCGCHLFLVSWHFFAANLGPTFFSHRSLFLLCRLLLLLPFSFFFAFCECFSVRLVFYLVG